MLHIIRLYVMPKISIWQSYKFFFVFVIFLGLIFFIDVICNNFRIFALSIFI